MKKCFLFIALCVSGFLQSAVAQVMFNAPDTVCVRQPISLTSNVFDAQNYYWGFCSGYLFNAPTGVNLGDNFSFSIPGNIDIVKDGDKYYGFSVNTKTREFIRLNFGNSLSNLPTVTNFGNMTNGLPVDPTTLFIVNDPVSRNWFIFVCGGFSSATSTLGRIDFGAHLDNPHPNIANFGNYKGILDYPKGIFIAKDVDDNWWGYLLNRNTNSLIRLDFSFNISNTPIVYDLGNPDGVFNEPNDLAAIKDAGEWHLFVTNYGSSSLVRVDIGTILDTMPATDIRGTDLGDFLFRILEPSSISINRDCDNIHAYITDSTTDQLIGISMPTARGPYNAVDYNNVGAMNFPTSISSIIRDHDNLFGFVTNGRDSTLTRIDFQQCNRSSIPFYTEVTPPTYSYDTPGVYNVYFVTNDGLPNMKVECHDITVLPPPALYMNADTVICQGDTARLYAVSSLADSIRWNAGYNIDTNYLYRDSVRVWPTYFSEYRLKLYYPFGCIVDTAIRVDVRRVVADAGPDRWIKDGGETVLGGPYTTTNGMYNYHWGPFNFLSDSTVTNPSAYPPQDQTYYLTVTDINSQLGCKAMDTVVVHVDCGEINVPNGFAPNSESSLTNRFGILNNDIVKLNYFKVFNRWGELVFEGTNISQQWDGTYNGQPAPVGVYVWEADAFCVSGKQIKKSGNVLLMR